MSERRRTRDEKLETRNEKRKETTMRAEAQAMVNEIEESLALLRRRL